MGLANPITATKAMQGFGSQAGCGSRGAAKAEAKAPKQRRRTGEAHHRNQGDARILRSSRRRTPARQQAQQPNHRGSEDEQAKLITATKATQGFCGQAGCEPREAANPARQPKNTNTARETQGQEIDRK